MYDLVELKTGVAFALEFEKFVLGATVEHVTMGKYHTSHIDGISSLGRLGLIIHSGSCWIDPGFSGTVTLEMSVSSQIPVILVPGMRIGQLVIETVDPPVQTLYGSDKLGSKYQGQTLPGQSKGN